MSWPAGCEGWTLSRQMGSRLWFDGVQVYGCSQRVRGKHFYLKSFFFFFLYILCHQWLVLIGVSLITAPQMEGGLKCVCVITGSLMAVSELHPWAVHWAVLDSSCFISMSQKYKNHLKAKWNSLNKSVKQTFSWQRWIISSILSESYFQVCYLTPS